MIIFGYNLYKKNNMEVVYMEECLTVREIAKQLNLTTLTVYRWVWSNKIDYIKIGRTIRIPKTSLKKFLQPEHEHTNTNESGRI